MLLVALGDCGAVARTTTREEDVSTCRPVVGMNAILVLRNLPAKKGTPTFRAARQADPGIISISRGHGGGAARHIAAATNVAKVSCRVGQTGGWPRSGHGTICPARCARGGAPVGLLGSRCNNEGNEPNDGHGCDDLEQSGGASTAGSRMHRLNHLGQARAHRKAGGRLRGRSKIWQTDTRVAHMSPPQRCSSPARESGRRAGSC